MAIALGTFVQHLKRESRYGQIAVTSDQATADILSSINKRLALIWARAEWTWGREILSFAISNGVRQYTVAAASGNAIGRIQDLIPYDSTGTFLNGRPLIQRTTRGFFERHGAEWGSVAPSTPAEYGAPAEFYSLGLDSSNRQRVVIWPTPGSASTMGGFAKALLTTYVNADVVNNTAIAYFPHDVVLDALFSGVMIDMALIQGMPVAESFAMERAFENKIARLVADQIGFATDNSPIQTRLPATVSRIKSRFASRRFKRQ